MTRIKFAGIVVSLVGLTLFTSALVCAQSGAPEVKEEKSAGCAHARQSPLKDAKVEVSNTADGVTIRITSDKAEAVKVLQVHFAKFGKSGHMRGQAGSRKSCGMHGKTGKAGQAGSACKMGAAGKTGKTTAASTCGGNSKGEGGGKASCDMHGTATASKGPAKGHGGMHHCGEAPK